MQNLHTGPFDIYAPLPFTFCIRANDVGNGVVPFPAFALTALGLDLDLACTNGDKVRLVNQFFHWRNPRPRRFAGYLKFQRNNR